MWLLFTLTIGGLLLIGALLILLCTQQHATHTKLRHHKMSSKCEVGVQGPVGSTGEMGVQGPAGGGTQLTVESGTFTRLNADGSGVQTVPTLKRATLLFFNARDPPSGFYSDGRSDAIIQNSIPLGAGLNNNGIDDQTNCIHVVDSGGNGFTGLVTAINNTSFDITWTKLNFGAPSVTVQWHGLMQ